MPASDPLHQARYIFTTGKKIHDWIFRMQSAHLAGLGKSQLCAELSMPQMHMLMLVRMKGTASVSELADRLGVSPPSASAMVDRLVEKNLLLRETSSSDRRRVDVRIVPRALQDLSELEDAVISYFLTLVERIGPETAGKWCEVLSRVEEVLKAEENSPGYTTAK